MLKTLKVGDSLEDMGLHLCVWYRCPNKQCKQCGLIKTRAFSEKHQNYIDQRYTIPPNMKTIYLKDSNHIETINGKIYRDSPHKANKYITWMPCKKCGTVLYEKSQEGIMV